MNLTSKTKKRHRRHGQISQRDYDKKKETSVKKTQNKKAEKKVVVTSIIANKAYGLYYGHVVSFDAETGVAKVKNCRHVCRWFGKTGGITSLAAHGICGPRAGESRIGAPCTATLTGVVNIFECSPAAAETFDAVVPL